MICSYRKPVVFFFKELTYLNVKFPRSFCSQSKFTVHSQPSPFPSVFLCWILLVACCSAETSMRNLYQAAPSRDPSTTPADCWLWLLHNVWEETRKHCNAQSYRANKSSLFAVEDVVWIVWIHFSTKKMLWWSCGLLTARYTSRRRGRPQPQLASSQVRTLVMMASVGNHIHKKSTG